MEKLIKFIKHFFLTNFNKFYLFYGKMCKTNKNKQETYKNTKAKIDDWGEWEWVTKKWESKQQTFVCNNKI